jgi:hypothetical protein
MTAYRLACTIVLTFASAAPTAFADTLLATFSYDSNAPLDAGWQPFISYGDPFARDAIVMNGVTITPVAIQNGLSFDLTGDLPAFSALATNGVNDPMHIGIFTPNGPGHNATATELSLLQTATLYVPGIGSPDFAGYTLTRISILGTGFNTIQSNMNTTTSFSFYGDAVSPAVPIPSVAYTGLASLAGLKLLGRRRHHASH